MWNEMEHWQNFPPTFERLSALAPLRLPPAPPSLRSARSESHKPPLNSHHRCLSQPSAGYVGIARSPSLLRAGYLSSMFTSNRASREFETNRLLLNGP